MNTILKAYLCVQSGNDVEISIYRNADGWLTFSMHLPEIQKGRFDMRDVSISMSAEEFERLAKLFQYASENI